MRQLYDILVIARKLRAPPEIRNSWQDGAFVATDIHIRLDVQVRASCHTAEDAAVALVPVIVAESISRDRWVPTADDVFGLVGNKAPDASTPVSAADMVQLPVRFDGRQLAVVVVIVVVNRVDELLVYC
jgi:hypothetical protein